MFEYYSATDRVLLLTASNEKSLLSDWNAQMAVAMAVAGFVRGRGRGVYEGINKHLTEHKEHSVANGVKQ